MIVTIVTFNLPQPTTLAEITKTFQGTAPKYRASRPAAQELLHERGRRARADLCVGLARRRRSRLHRRMARLREGKYGTPPTIEYLHSPVMVDNGAGTISVAA